MKEYQGNDLGAQTGRMFRAYQGVGNAMRSVGHYMAKAVKPVVRSNFTYAVLAVGLIAGAGCNLSSKVGGSYHGENNIKLAHELHSTVGTTKQPAKPVVFDPDDKTLQNSVDGMFNRNAEEARKK
jgi:hypothetical protein